MISAEMLEQVADSVSAVGELNEGALAGLKRCWPDLRFTLCSDEDMPARMPPALRRGGFNLYMVGGGEHCISLTTDPEQAIGLVVAQVDEM